jgi:hypothetical protein
MPRVEFEPTIPALKRAKTIYALDHSDTVTVTDTISTDCLREACRPYSSTSVTKHRVLTQLKYLTDQCQR